MDGNTRFELMSASPDSNFVGNYQNGQRGYSAPTLGRSSSFREGSESRNMGSGKLNSRGSATSSGDMPALSQCLTLEQFPTGDLKNARAVDLKRVLGFSVGSNSEENSFGIGHLKSSPPAAVEELKRLRANVADTCIKASGRAKKLDEHLNKLNRLFEVIPSKKQQQRNEIMTNERSSGSNLKTGSQIHRNSSDLGNQKFDDRPKNVVLNKRLRTSMAETRTECRNIGVPRQPLMGTKERDMLKDINADSDMVEEEIRRLPAGGEGWDKKMKRKRSVGPVFPRSVDNDGDLKRNMHHKLTIESSLHSIDSAHGFRSGASGGANKLDPIPSPAGSTARMTFKNEQEKSMHSRDLSAGPVKERPLGKVNVKLNSREDNLATCSNPIVKVKPSRAPRSGSTAAANSAANAARLSGTLESWEQPQPVNKTTPSIGVGGANNRKRALPAGSSSPPITQWVGQRPQKISRTRRTNLIPVSNHDEVQIQSEGSSPSDFGPRVNIGGINASLLSKSAANGNPNFKVKPENYPSPARLSESEESGAGENRINDKGLGSRDLEEKFVNAGQSAGPSVIPRKKNKIMVKEDIGDGVRRQGRSGRVSPFSRGSISPTREKLDNVVPTKPLQNVRSGSDKSGSKSGRPSKKLSDRKGVSRLGHLANGGSPDCSGESDDDREELLTAANLACSSSFSSCSSALWKTVEDLFTSVGPDDKLYLSEQLKLSEERSASLSQNCNKGNLIQEKMDDYGHEEIAAPEPISCLKDSLNRMDFAEQFQSCSDAEKRFEIITPLYQRVLSALIVEDEIEEYEDTEYERPKSSLNDSCFPYGTENKFMDRLDYCEPIFGVQTRKNGNAHKVFPCYGNKDTERSTGAQDRICNGELLQIDGGYGHPDVDMLVRLSRYDNGPQSLQANNSGIQYEQMCLEEKLVAELQSVGLFLEAVPALDDKEDDSVDQEIIRLKRRFFEKNGKNKTSLHTLYKAVEEGNNIRRDPERVAMDKLVELAYKKLLATKGSFASKHGISKVSKQTALSFGKRTLSRWRKFQDSGASRFSEPPLREIVYSAPPRFAETELLSSANLPIANNGALNRQYDQAKNGTIVTNRGKKKEVLLDEVGGGGAVFRASSALGIMGGGGAKGKRSERDSKNAISKTGKLAVGGGSKGERKTKTKPKQRTAQLSTSGNNAFVNKFVDTPNSMLYPSASGSGESGNNSGDRRKDVRFMSSSNNAPSVSSSKDVMIKEPIDFGKLPLNDLDGIEELGVDSEIGAPQDLNTWFNFDVDGLQEDDCIGLEIPNDDLMDLNMF
ncbi:hypothetical protein ABFS82_06G085900 [Erythranthe guttata]|nr:PREDICTED: uncharacterized protein LOC105977632 [Erythranthe guttata]XP_012858414.1 PREDICTED: uncharacterized protein LOC105977632 [Erythranthe guttata]|eukprot:XP_012858412.1 PREDICTED: uncharacterized protein LOC105977632 [Erythranthe guttata]